MDSNSPSPFLGLELSVDAHDAQQQDGGVPVRTVSSDSATSSDSLLGDRIDAAPDTRFVTTSESLEHSGSLRFSLPAVELKAGSTDAEEVDAIMNRFPGS